MWGLLWDWGVSYSEVAVSYFERPSVRIRTAPTTVADYQAVCETCGWHATTRNGILLAAQHHGRTGHKVTCEVVYTVVWNAAVDEGLPLFPHETGHRAEEAEP